MKSFLLAGLLLVIGCSPGAEGRKVEWGKAGSLSIEYISETALNYSISNFPHLAKKDILVKVSQVSASFKLNISNPPLLEVYILHSDSFKTGSSFEDFEGYNSLEAIVVAIDEQGKAISDRLFELPFDGNKDEFLSELQEL